MWVGGWWAVYKANFMKCKRYYNVIVGYCTFCVCTMSEFTYLPLFLSPPPSLLPIPPSLPLSFSLAVLRRSHSPMSIAKSLFRLSGSHIRDHSSVSPLSSPILGGRKKSPLSSPILGGRKKMKNHHRGEGGEFMFPWMNDVKRTERNHWQQMLSLEGEWVYCWHIFRPNLKPVHS